MSDHLFNPAFETRRERENTYLASLLSSFTFLFFSSSIAASQKTESRQFGAQRTLIVLWSAPSRRCMRTHSHTDMHTRTHTLESCSFILCPDESSTPCPLCFVAHTRMIYTPIHTHTKCQALCIQSCNIQNLSHTHKCTITYPWNIIDFLLESFAKENSIFKSPMLSLPAWRKDNIDWNIDLCMWCFSGVHCFLLYQTLTLRQLEHTVTDLDRCFVGKSLSWFNELVFYSDPIVGSLLRFAILLTFSASHALTKRGFFPQRINRFPNQSVGTSAVCHSSSLLPHILRLQRL